MKLSHYAKKLGISYQTAWKQYQKGLIQGYQLSTGTIIVTENTLQQRKEKVVIYARVSSKDREDNLERQIERLETYCLAKGYIVAKVYKEIASGINDQRKQLLAMLADVEVTRIVVEHKDRLTRFGFNYLETLLSQRGCSIEVVYLSKDKENELVDDLTAIIYSFCAKLYGLRRAKHKAESVQKALLSESD